MSASVELRILRGVPLAERTTLGLGGAAELFFEATSEADLIAALAWAKCDGVPVTILGGGSNVIVPDAGVAGLVLVPALRGVDTQRAPDSALVRVRAGEPWDELVAATVRAGLAGLECLSGIPGSTGATPIQNVGAYGVEVADVLTSVTCLDRHNFERRVFSRDECGFAYRDSRLKRERDRFIVLEVEFALRSGAPSPARYAELLAALGESPTLADVRNTVIALRRRKSMVVDRADPNGRSAGSFFTNPIVSEALAKQVVALAVERGHAPDAARVPTYPQPDGRVKLAAGWLIEKSGVRKGERSGHVGVSTAHALALVHHGGGSTDELLAFAETVRERVRHTFGVELEREPIVLVALSG